MPKVLKLPDVTLLSVAGINQDNAVKALEKSMKGIEYHEVKIISPIKPLNLPRSIIWEESPSLPLRKPGIDEYSRFMIYELWKYVSSPYCLTIHADGFVINRKKWSNIFLDYDYIGAPWVDNMHFDPFGNSQRIGNGGFSLRSRRLLCVPLSHSIPFEVNNTHFYRHNKVNLLHEDGNICVHNRHIYEEAGCRFAPIEVAVRFSQEHFVKEARWVKPFGFHRQRPRFWRNLLPENLSLLGSLVKSLRTKSRYASLKERKFFQ